MSADLIANVVGAPQVPPPVVPGGAPVAHKEPVVLQPKQQPEVTLQEDQEKLLGKVEQATKQLNAVMATFNKKLHFQVHEGTDRTYVQVVDKETQKVLKEFPNRELLDTVARFHDVIGMILDMEG